MAEACVGTSGYSYPHWAGGVFYPAGLPQSKWLDFYAKTFPTVELNVSFYRLPSVEAFVSWRERTPATFRYAVKGSRYITHVKKLKDCAEPLRRFSERADGLAEKLGVVLWQLPPGWHVDLDRLKAFAELLDAVAAPGARHAFEFRQESWFTDEVYELLRRHRFALVIAHSTRWPRAEVTTADFVYLRFHGGEVLYDSDYSAAELAEWAGKARVWLKEGRDVFAYFNNDAHGYAVKNALEFDRLISARRLKTED